MKEAGIQDFPSQREMIGCQSANNRNYKLDAQNCWCAVCLQLFFNNIVAGLRIRVERLHVRKLVNHWLVAGLNLFPLCELNH
jgi:hypothetical protein